MFVYTCQPIIATIITICELCMTLCICFKPGCLERLFTATLITLKFTFSMLLWWWRAYMLLVKYVWRCEYFFRNYPFMNTTFHIFLIVTMEVSIGKPWRLIFNVTFFYIICKVNYIVYYNMQRTKYTALLQNKTFLSAYRLRASRNLWNCIELA